MIIIILNDLSHQLGSEQALANMYFKQNYFGILEMFFFSIHI